jgi:hypothetical protein
MTADELYDLIREDIERALDEPDHSMRMTRLRAAGDVAFRLAYEDVPGDPKGVDQASIDFLNVLNAAMVHTNVDGTEEQADRIARVWAVAAANGAHYYSDPGGDKTWITREDDRVRETHVPMHGVTVRSGQSFMVAGVPMRYPGEPVGPPDHWINCRCTLSRDADALASASLTSDAAGDGVAGPACPHPAALSPGSPELAEDTPGKQPAATEPDELTARAFDTGKRKAMAKRGTAMPDGSFPIANAEDLRNAIQAIGRAKDPAKAKAHIRKRARALNLTSLIPDSWTAAACDECDPLVAVSSPISPGTHDGPGWLTHPRDTQRLRDYWTKGAGAAKIAWGTPNDLTRCHKYLVKYVGPTYAWGTCQNLHKVALGTWNENHRGRGTKSVLKAAIDDDDPAIIALIDAAFAAAAELEDDMETLAHPLEWFQDPGFEAPTPLTITSDGRVLGHLASWETCHVGITGECIKPPHSNTDYAHFRTGEVETADGELVAVGQITMDTGHAEKGDGPQAAVSHYDNTGTGVADVNAGEDAHGIWVAGAMRPGVSEQQMYVLKATGALSGDWRRIGGNLELVAALAVNVPGFPIPRVAMAAAASGQTLSLIAAAVVTADPNAEQADRIAVAVLARMKDRDDRSRRATLILDESRRLRVDSLVAAARDYGAG